MKFSSQGKQLSTDAFRSSLDSLSKSNRWVQLGDTLPWSDIERLYNHRLNNGMCGAGNKPTRMIIGALELMANSCNNWRRTLHVQGLVD